MHVTEIAFNETNVKVTLYDQHNVTSFYVERTLLPDHVQQAYHIIAAYINEHCDALQQRWRDSWTAS